MTHYIREHCALSIREKILLKYPKNLANYWFENVFVVKIIM